MVCSMSRKGDCWDNAPMESFFGSLKTELEGDGPFPTRQAAKTALLAHLRAQPSINIGRWTRDELYERD